MRNLLIISRGNDKPFSQALINICGDVRYIFLLAVEDFLRLLVQGIVFLDINDLQLVVHSFAKTEPFDYGVFVDTANGHSVGGLVFLFRHRKGRGGHMLGTYIQWDTLQLSFFDMLDFDIFNECPETAKFYIE
ncbi:hypothetical protein D2V05_03795 [Flagellimonas pelagia]|uniref:Uncharacterized protein n=1 Tax=Flagellimonas pelagia TaxID=2306998 RepID=A0A3A1NN32_9FLAO|nr:hypothetical protein D2V05_03795 [Allomuricauda maritima]